ncbi:MAG: hypothetical protein ACRD3Q_02280 [Terriglobales bacterium]
MALGKKTGGGSRKGSPNKATSGVREAFTLFVENNSGKAQKLFDRVAKDDPAKALDLLARLAEFVVPKLARSEISGEIGIRGRLEIHD